MARYFFSASVIFDVTIQVHQKIELPSLCYTRLLLLDVTVLILIHGSYKAYLGKFIRIFRIASKFQRPFRFEQLCKQPSLPTHAPPTMIYPQLCLLEHFHP